MMMDLDELQPKIIPDIIRSMEQQYRAQRRDADENIPNARNKQLFVGKGSRISRPSRLTDHGPRRHRLSGIYGLA